MEKTIQINDQQFYLEIVTGVAVSAERQTIEHRKREVSGGDRGYVMGNYVRIDPIKITETVTEEHLQDFALLGLDGIEREFRFKNEKHSVNIRPGNIVSVVLGAKAPGGKKAPYMVCNHTTLNSATLGAFDNAVAFSDLRMCLVLAGGLLLAFLLSLPWYGYVLLAAAAYAAHYAYFIKFKRRVTAGQYLDSDECRTWRRELRKDDNAYRRMIGQSPIGQDAMVEPA